MPHIDEALLRYLASAALGWLAAIITFRTRLVVIEGRLTVAETAIKNLTPAIRDIDRRSIYMLQYMADIGAKVGVDRRVPDDMLVRYLTEENDSHR